MARQLAVVAVVVIVLALALVGLRWLPAAQVTPPAAAQPVASERTITVVGNGSSYVEPDVAQSTIGVNVAAPTVEEASEQVNERMSAVMDALREAGIADEDIQTVNYSIFFEEQQPVDRPTPDATETEPSGKYRVVNEVRVTMRDLESVGSVLDAAIEAGANNVYGVSFTRDDVDDARSEARADAVSNARAKAEEYADLNGLTLGEVVSVSEVIGSAAPYFGERDLGAGLGGGTGISPGQLEVQVQIQVTYDVSQ